MSIPGLGQLPIKVRLFLPHALGSNKLPHGATRKCLETA